MYESPFSFLLPPMSDFAWIAFIIIIYLLVIRPMFQGAVGKQMPPKPGNNTRTNNNPPGKQPDKKTDGDYVDYEEVK